MRLFTIIIVVGLARSEAEDAIKTMKLYTHLQRFDNELKERGLPLEGPLEAEALSAIDSMHYHGTHAVDAASKQLGLDSSSRVLEIGSGLGGVARRVASTTGASVVALELQADVSKAARALTQRCGLDQTVEHVCGDALKAPPELQARSFTQVISFLCLLHIADKDAILKAAFDALEPGGSLLVEDFYDLGVTAEEKATLKQDVFAFNLLSREAYKLALSSAGFRIHEWTDLTSSWTDYTTARAIAYSDAEDRHVRVHGRATFSSQKHFYDSVRSLFAGGHLGGVKYVAVKPAAANTEL